LELQDFTRQLNGEVRDRVISGTGDSTFSEQIFTELVFEYLSEIGMVEEPELCYLDHRYKRSIIRLNGFSFSADGDELDLFVTLFLDLAEPVLISKDKLVEAGQQGAAVFMARPCSGSTQMRLSRRILHMVLPKGFMNTIT